MKGYGQSEGIKAYFSNMDNWVDDLLRYIDLTAPTFPEGLPRYLLGYSMGGCLAVYTSILHPNIAKKIITFAPALFKPVYIYIYIYIGKYETHFD